MVRTFKMKVMCLSSSHLYFVPFNQRSTEVAPSGTQSISWFAPVAYQLPLTPLGSVVREKVRVSGKNGWDWRFWGDQDERSPTHYWTQHQPPSTQPDISMLGGSLLKKKKAKLRKGTEPSWAHFSSAKTLPSCLQYLLSWGLFPQESTHLPLSGKKTRHTTYSIVHTPNKYCSRRIQLERGA